MPDAQDAAWRLRQRRHADQTRRRLTRIFDADGDGLSDSTLPMFGLRTEGRQGPPPSPISLPVGETVTLRATNVEVPSGGADVTLTDQIGDRAGFGSLTLPASQVPVSVHGYYDVHLSGRWASWTGGGTITLKRNGTAVFGPAQDGRLTDPGPASGFRGVIPHRLVTPGDTFELHIDHGDSGTHTLEQVVVTVGLVDTPHLFLVDAEPQGPTEMRGLTHRDVTFWCGLRDYQGGQFIGRLDATWRVVQTIATPGWGKVYGVDIDPAGRFWVTESQPAGGSRIYRLSAAGAVLDTFTSPDGETRGLVHDGTDVWVVGGSNQRIYRLDADDGSTLSSFAYAGSGDIPGDDLTIESGDLIFSERISGDVRRYSTAGSLLDTVTGAMVSIAFDGDDIWGRVFATSVMTTVTV